MDRSSYRVVFCNSWDDPSSHFHFQCASTVNIDLADTDAFVKPNNFRCRTAAEACSQNFLKIAPLQTNGRIERFGTSAWWAGHRWRPTKRGGIDNEYDNQPMPKRALMLSDCSATSKRTGQPCRAPAVEGSRSSIAWCAWLAHLGGAGNANISQSFAQRSSIITTLFEENPPEQEVRGRINDLL